MELKPTGECELWKDEQIQVFQIFGLGFVEDGIRPVQVVVHIAYLWRKLETRDFHGERCSSCYRDAELFNLIIKHL